MAASTRFSMHFCLKSASTVPKRYIIGQKRFVLGIGFAYDQTLIQNFKWGIG